MKNRNRVIILLAAFWLFAAGAAWSHEEQGEAAPPAMSPEDQAMMEAWHAAAVPGPEHAGLMEDTGTWNVEQKMWMKPGTEPMVMHGTAEREAMLGGRVLREGFSGMFMGEAYQGVAHTGYDNVTDTYWVTWIDNMSTAVHTGEGTCEEDYSSCTFTLVGPNPMTGGELEMRMEIVFEEGREVHTFYETRDGEEFKSMEMIYTRAGAE